MSELVIGIKEFSLPFRKKIVGDEGTLGDCKTREERKSGKWTKFSEGKHDEIVFLVLRYDFKADIYETWQKKAIDSEKKTEKTWIYS